MGPEKAFLVAVKAMLQKLEQQNESVAAIYQMLLKKNVFSEEEVLAMLADIQKGEQAQAAQKRIDAVGKMTQEQALELLENFEGPIQ